MIGNGECKEGQPLPTPTNKAYERRSCFTVLVAKSWDQPYVSHLTHVNGLAGIPTRTTMNSTPVHLPNDGNRSELNPSLLRGTTPSRHAPTPSVNATQDPNLIPGCCRLLCRRSCPLRAHRSSHECHAIQMHLSRVRRRSQRRGWMQQWRLA